MEHYDVIIIGTGAAGLSAGVYAGRYNLKTLIIGKEFGGETARAGAIENWPGIISIDGYDLMKNMKEHAKHVGAEIMDGTVEKIEKKDGCFDVIVKGKIYHATNVVLALGAERRRLGLPHEAELTGNGVHFCITCDGPLYAGKTIAVVGGGDASVKGINLAAQYAEKIYLLVRSDALRAEPINVERMKQLGDKVEILYQTAVTEIVVKDGKFDKISLSKEYNGGTELDIDGLFIEAGAMPNTTITESLALNTDKAGYLEVNNMMQTNVPGVTAAGDIVNHFGHFKQDITSSAMGAVAATAAYEYYKEHKSLGGCSHGK